MGMRRSIAAALAGVLILACLLISGCGEGDEDASEETGELSMWLTETSLEDPGAWFSVSILPVE